MKNTRVKELLEKIATETDQDKLDIMKAERNDFNRRGEAVPMELARDIADLEAKIAAKRNAPNPLDAIKDDAEAEAFSAQNILNIIKNRKKDC